MFRFKIKKPIFFALIILLSLSLYLANPFFKTPFLSFLKLPLGLFSAIRREAGAIIFYHRNYVENEKLRQKLDELNNRLNAQTEVFLENKRLKDALGLKQKSAYRLATSLVIGRSLDSWSQALIIDKGSSHGIREGMTVINYLGMVGCVVEVLRFNSKVLLINDPNIAVSGLIQRSRQEGLVCGTLGKNLIMKYLPSEADIKIQDAVVTSGLNGLYPKGLLIGTVVGLGFEFSGLGRYALIKPIVNLNNIEEVLVILQ
ncbi:MAG: rod shape-determining protein MreC [Candidatus Omnitrophota bacterium]|nr:rod shape-determining protein MreC [Candidatus Omnitrophota bacterium]